MINLGQTSDRINMDNLEKFFLARYLRSPKAQSFALQFCLHDSGDHHLGGHPERWIEPV